MSGETFASIPVDGFGEVRVRVGAYRTLFVGRRPLDGLATEEWEYAPHELAALRDALTDALVRVGAEEGPVDNPEPATRRIGHNSAPDQLLTTHLIWADEHVQTSVQPDGYVRFDPNGLLDDVVDLDPRDAEQLVAALKWGIGESRRRANDREDIYW